MMYCHKCLKRIWLWESKAEGCHIKCLPIEERCKYYHIQRDISMSVLFALFIVTPIIAFTNSVLIYYYMIITGIFIFISGNITLFIMRKEEEEEERENV